MKYLLIIGGMPFGAGVVVVRMEHNKKRRVCIIFLKCRMDEWAVAAGQVDLWRHSEAKMDTCSAPFYWCQATPVICHPELAHPRTRHTRLLACKSPQFFDSSDGLGSIFIHTHRLYQSESPNAQVALFPNPALALSHTHTHG